MKDNNLPEIEKPNNRNDSCAVHVAFVLALINALEEGNPLDEQLWCELKYDATLHEDVLTFKGVFDEAFGERIPILRSVLNAYVTMVGRLAHQLASQTSPTLVGIALSVDQLPEDYAEALWLTRDILLRIRDCLRTMQVEFSFRSDLDPPVQFPRRPYIRTYDEDANPLEQNLKENTAWSMDHGLSQFWVNYPEFGPTRKKDQKYPQEALAEQLKWLASNLRNKRENMTLPTVDLKELRAVLRTPTGYEYMLYAQEDPESYDWGVPDWRELFPPCAITAFNKALREALQAMCEAAPGIDELKTAHAIFTKRCHDNRKGNAKVAFWYDDPKLSPKDAASLAHDLHGFMEAFEKGLAELVRERQLEEIARKAQKGTRGTPGRHLTKAQEQQVEAGLDYLEKHAEEGTSYSAAARAVLADPRQKKDWAKEGYQNTKNGFTALRKGISDEAHEDKELVKRINEGKDKRKKGIV